MNATVRIARRAAERLRAGHLWVYRTDVEQIEGEPGAGALVTVEDGRGAPLGTALYSTTSQIAARMVSRTAGLVRTEYLEQVRERVAAALALRRELAQWSVESRNTRDSAQRLIFAEADGLPGILADQYNELVVLQLVTQGTAQEDVRAVIVQALREGLAANGEPLTVWERADARIRELEQLAAPAEGPLFTTAAGTAPSTTTFAVNGVRFGYDVAAGQKTGAFLDQRLNYRAAAEWVRRTGRRASASGFRALDVCTYQGGFALHLAEVCERVTGVDQSRAALEVAESNLKLNPQLRAEVDWIEADAFALLRALDEAARGGSVSSDLPMEVGRFDVIVLDPPAFAKSKRAMEGALRGYKELNLRAMRLLEPGGTLVTCSCSQHVSLAEFTAVVAAAASDAGRRVQLLETRAAAPDHPEVLTLPETRYLKCLICRVD
ncbi:MAG TPA: class I SAM-dependent rRNA methyltransferase [Acidobacteriaceae bacterium]|jgi:23S rRNA (cytosine1962-C5)-methyltransferase|nr:class I SAM-dependent rRNA methyltransferase [Acidobacteriaceae bacterium]